MAYALMERSPDGGSYFNPQGKATMLRGGVGAVRLRPRQIAGEPHYFMTASANGVCHEGFPVLVPRRFYGPLKATMLRQGAAAVTLSGEMRYVYDGLPTFFDSSRQIPQLYLYVDRIADLPGPRPEVEAFTVSAAVSFIGKFEAQEGVYTTYATFDPASPGSLREAVHWMEKFYVAEQYQVVVVTDFDEVQPRFSGVVFGLPDLLAGKLDNEKVAQFLEKYGFDSDAGQPYYVVYQEINTQGGAYIEGDVDTDGGDFIGRDQIINGGE